MQNYYKDTSGNVYAYDDEQVAMGLAANKVAMSAAETAAHVSPPKTAEQAQQEVNAEARAYLVSTDWYVTRRSEIGEAIPEEVLAARQAARERIV